MKLKLFAVALLLAGSSYAQEEVKGFFSQLNGLIKPLQKGRAPPKASAWQVHQYATF
jgi:hypothetical protein